MRSIFRNFFLNYRPYSFSVTCTQSYEVLLGTSRKHRRNWHLPIQCSEFFTSFYKIQIKNLQIATHSLRAAHVQFKKIINRVVFEICLKGVLHVNGGKIANFNVVFNQWNALHSWNFLYTFLYISTISIVAAVSFLREFQRLQIYVMWCDVKHISELNLVFWQILNVYLEKVKKIKNLKNGTL